MGRSMSLEGTVRMSWSDLTKQQKEQMQSEQTESKDKFLESGFGQSLRGEQVWPPKMYKGSVKCEFPTPPPSSEEIEMVHKVANMD